MSHTYLRRGHQRWLDREQSPLPDVRLLIMACRDRAVLEFIGSGAGPAWSYLIAADLLLLLGPGSGSSACS